MYWRYHGPDRRDHHGKLGNQRRTADGLQRAGQEASFDKVLAQKRVGGGEFCNQRGYVHGADVFSHRYLREISPQSGTLDRRVIGKGGVHCPTDALSLEPLTQFTVRLECHNSSSGQRSCRYQISIEGPVSLSRNGKESNGAEWIGTGYDSCPAQTIMLAPTKLCQAGFCRQEARAALADGSEKAKDLTQQTRTLVRVKEKLRVSGSFKNHEFFRLRRFFVVAGNLRQAQPVTAFIASGDDK